MEFFKPGILIQLRSLDESDLDVIAAWPSYDDPLLERCRLPYRSLDEWRQWFRQTNGRSDVERIALQNTDETLVGIITSQSLPSDASAEEGIKIHMEISSKFARQGYGFDGLTAFLDSVFDMPSPLETIEVQFPAFNRIAIRFFNTFSFQKVKTVWDKEPLGQKVYQIKEFRPFMQFFRVMGNQTEVTCFVNRLPRINWIDKRNRIIALREEKSQRPKVSS